MAYQNTFVTARRKSYFVVEETTPGTLAFPTASNAIYLTDYVAPEQSTKMSDLMAIRESLTALPKIMDGFGSGTFSGLSLSARVSGTAGTAPGLGEITLLKCALGKVTSGATSTVSAIAVSGATKANPSVFTIPAGHTFQAGDIITMANCTVAAFNGSHILASVTSTTVTTATDSSAYASAATDGDITLAMTRIEPAQVLPHFSIWCITGEYNSATGGAIIEAYSGCMITSGPGISLEKKAELKYTFSGKFQREYHGGTATLSATAANGATTLTFSSGSYLVDQLFFVGQKVNVIDPAGTVTLSAPVTVSAVNTSGNTITVGTMTVADGPFPTGSIVKPYLPTPSITGQVVPLAKMGVYFGAYDTGYGSASGKLFHSASFIGSNKSSISIEHTVEAPGENECNLTLYPTAGFVVKDRKVSGSVEIALRYDDQKLYKSLEDEQRRSVGISVGTTAGAIVDIYIPQVFMEKPKRSPETAGGHMETLSWTAQEPTLGQERELMIVLR